MGHRRNRIDENPAEVLHQQTFFSGFRPCFHGFQEAEADYIAFPGGSSAGKDFPVGSDITRRTAGAERIFQVFRKDRFFFSALYVAAPRSSMKSWFFRFRLNILTFRCPSADISPAFFAAVSAPSLIPREISASIFSQSIVMNYSFFLILSCCARFVFAQCMMQTVRDV